MRRACGFLLSHKTVIVNGEAFPPPNNCPLPCTPKPMPSRNAMGAPGLEFETWDPPRKGQSRIPPIFKAPLFIRSVGWAFGPLRAMKNLFREPLSIEPLPFPCHPDRGSGADGPAVPRTLHGNV
jgi:hypothetical protein